MFVVDDDASTLALLCDVAEAAGWTARGFRRLHEVRAQIGAHPPSLVIVDDELPDGRGGDLARDLQDDGQASVPIVVCTAAHPRRQAEIGAWAPVISKPFDLVDIERLLLSVGDGGTSGAVGTPRGG